MIIKGRYLLEEILSKKHLGKSYKAFDFKQQKTIVIKTISESNLWEKMRDKKSTILSLSCEHIVKIYDIFTWEKENFVVMQYIEGISLNSLIATLKLNLNEIFLIARDICDALVYLNSQGMVHKDIKPSNIIYNEKEKKAILIDLDFIGQNKSNFYSGTLIYSAPEQISKNISSIKSDLFSLGLILYELIEGKPLYENSESGIREKVGKQVEIKFSRFKDAVLLPPVDAIKQILTEMLSLDPEKRIDPESALDHINKIISDIEKHGDEILLLPPDFCNNSIKPPIISQTGLDMPTSYLDLTVCLELPDVLKSESTNILDVPECLNENIPNTNYIDRNANTHDKLYSSQLYEEYKHILTQANIAFWLWVSSFIVCFGIIIVAIIQIFTDRYLQAAITTLLQSLVYCVQRLFSIREDHYREIINRKMLHLEKGDYLEYAFSKIEYMNDLDEKNRLIVEFVKSIRENIEQPQT